MTYRLRDISDVKAVYRGYKTGSVDTRTYMIIVYFDKNSFRNSSMIDGDESFESSSDDQFEKEKDELRKKDLRDSMQRVAFLQGEQKSK